jgi:hypothetical protein
MNKHDQWQNLASPSGCTNIATNKSRHDSDPILGIEVAAYCPQPQDKMLTVTPQDMQKSNDLLIAMTINPKSLTLSVVPMMQ